MMNKLSASSGFIDYHPEQDEKVNTARVKGSTQTVYSSVRQYTVECRVNVNDSLIWSLTLKAMVPPKNSQFLTG